MYGLGKNGYTWIYSAFSLFLVLACLTHSTEGGALRSKKFDDDLPGEVEDRVIERLAKEGNQQTDGGSSGADDSKDGGSLEDRSAVALDKKEADAAVETEESHPKPFTGEIVLEEWQFMLIVGGCIVLAVIGVAIAFYCCYRIQTATKDAEAEYPSYGVTGPGAALSGDRKLAQSAQMYHYQHQKQQMIAMQKREKGESAEDASDYDSEEENEDGDLTVYECPGLAPTGEMQVKNPLFSEEQYKEATPPPAEEKP
ncbi:neural proliferation differentiation and control protein 1-like isoform X2 [Apostichopus japonicus]|uniref:neural proliferation differentiation and control protein 1-like isoform X2 n=1 Tax=Stichopus japonicus TaxID=307972 RepID=UPI003AB1429E